MTRKICKKKPHPLISLFIISASIQHFLPLIERYISRTPTSLGPVQLCLQQNCNFGPLPTDRQLSKWLCRAEQSRAESTDCKAENPAFPSLSTPGASLLPKASYLCCGEETASFFLCCFESLANLGLCDLAISSNVALSTPKTPTSTGVLNRHEIEKYKEDHSGFGECWRGKATSTHCP